MKNQWELFKVGMRRGEWMGTPDGMIMEWNDVSGLVLFVYYNNPRNREKEQLDAGKRFEIAFKDIDNVGFFAVKFGEQPWADCCFSPNLYPEKPKFDEPGPGKTYALHIMFIDSAVGELKGLRSIALGREFTEKFRQWCLQSLKKNVGRFYYNRVIDEAFKKYPTPAHMAKEADFRWVSTHGEDAPKRGAIQKE